MIMIMIIIYVIAHYQKLVTLGCFIRSGHAHTHAFPSFGCNPVRLIRTSLNRYYYIIKC